MAEAKTRKSRTAAPATPEGTEAPVNEVEVPVEKPQTRKKTTKKENIIPKDIDLSQFITVINGFQGSLIYKSKRTGEIFEWDSFGDEQEIELRELKNAKNSSKKFFENNWFMFEEDWVIDYLGVRGFYKHAINIDEFDSIFDRTADELKEIIPEMSKGQKRSLAYRATQMIADKKIDSLSVISTLEECLGVELIER